MFRRWPLVGRSAELEVIADATRATADRARGIVLSGSAGVGKTHLAREAVAGCGPRSARRLWIVGTASARSVPLAAFAHVAGGFGPDPLRRVREVIEGLIGDSPGEVIVGVDDAHLLDDLSAFTVHQLVTRRLATVILTIRSGESPPDAITAIWKDQHLERLELQPLSETEIADLLAHVLDGPVHSASAQRLWQYTQGNALYLRHLLDNEVSAGRMAQRSGMWMWHGQPELSPSLAELVEARSAQAPPAVRDVLDALAVAEPLDADVLTAVTDADALTEAESLGLIIVDSRVQPPSVRLAHPMIGEVRRMGLLRQRRVRGRIATELARRSESDPRDLVRRAVLTVESDLDPDPGLLNAATWAAMQLLDLRLAQTLAEQAVSAGSGIEAKITLVMALTWQERGHDAERVLAELAEGAPEPMQTQVALLRALNFAVILGQTASAERELDTIDADDDATAALTAALRALVDVVRGHARTAVDRGRTNLAGTGSNDLARMLSIFAMVNGLGELGDVEELNSVADMGYQLADRSAEVSHLRVPLAFLHAYAYRPAGALAQSDATIARIRRDTVDVPFEGSWNVAESWHAFVAGLSAMNRGALADARRRCHESLADATSSHGGRMRTRFARLWLTIVAGMCGDAADARREFEPIQQWDSDPDARGWHSERSIAQAWLCAAEDAVPQAISILREAAERDRGLGRPAWEVLLLQTATQFGDCSTAERLSELVAEVEGPRAPAAAAHVAALAAGDGDGLLDASRRYEEFGDRIAAADAAAQAVIAYQDDDAGSAALSASAAAQRLATECQGARTPALRTATTRPPFTLRQREIISLAAQGLSNKEIADRLTMSIRSIEGHLFRASQRVGANSREQLISILRGG